MIVRIVASYVLLALAGIVSCGVVVWFLDANGVESRLVELLLGTLVGVGVVAATAGLIARDFVTRQELSTDLAVQGRVQDLIRALEEDKDLLQTILTGMDEGVVAFDANQQILFSNQRALDLLEYSSQDPVGLPLSNLLRNPSIRDTVDRGLRGSTPHRERVELKGGSESTLSIYVARLPNSKTPSSVMVIDDITEQSRFERLRQDFVANVSHELKTPLANIRSSVEVLQDGAAEDPASRSMFLAQIDEQSLRLHALVLDLLNLAKMESGNFTLELEAVQVEDAVHNCLDRHRTRAEVKGHSLHGVALAGCPPTLTVWANDEAFAQILDNLVDNAIKYTNPGGRVTVRWSADDQNVFIEVEDTGLGIPEEDLPRVFERFYRVDKARSREMGGTGLGLAIVKHMVQLLHGSVRVSSEITKGTTFRVTLPRGPRPTS